MIRYCPLLLLGLLLVISTACDRQAQQEGKVLQGTPPVSRMSSALQKVWKGSASPVVVTAKSVTVGGVARTRAQVSADMDLARQIFGSDLVSPDLVVGGGSKPLRHFGRFHLGSPQLRISGTSAEWHYREFFTGNPDAHWWRKYFKPTLPVDDFDTLVAGEYSPGTMAQPGRINDTLLDLMEVRWSSMFGGSVALLFRSLEDNEYDFRTNTQLAGSAQESIAWDVRDIGMSIHVIPTRTAINSAQNNQFNTIPSICDPPLQVVFELPNPIAYVVRGSAASFTVRPDPDPDGRKAELDSLARDIAGQLGNQSSLWADACRIAYGFIHSQFQAELGDTNLVDNIDISDDFLDLYTRAGNPTVFVDLRIDAFNLDTEPGSEEISTTIALEHIFSTGQGAVNPVVVRGFDDIDDGEGTPRRTYGVFAATSEGLPSALLASVRISEEDTFSPNDNFRSEAFNVPFDRDAFVALAATGGPFDGSLIRTRQIGYIYRGDDLHGTFGFESVVSMGLR